MRIEIWLDILAVVDISDGDSCATISLVAMGLRLNNRRPIERLTQSNRIDPIIPNGSYLECVIEIDTALLTENGMKKKKKKFAENRTVLTKVQGTSKRSNEQNESNNLSIQLKSSTIENKKTKAAKLEKFHDETKTDAMNKKIQNCEPNRNLLQLKIKPKLAKRNTYVRKKSREKKIRRPKHWRNERRRWRREE